MFTPEELIHFAREIAGSRALTGSAAVRARTAHSRTYYGLFLIIRSILVGRHGLHVRRVEHGLLIRRMQYSSVSGELRELGRELERLYSIRQKADYDLAPSPEWQTRVEDPEFAAVSAARVLVIAERVRHLDFSPLVPLL